MSSGGATVAQVVQAPALPAANSAAYHAAAATTTRPACWSSALRKYVILCTACGGMAALLGALFLLVHFVLRAHTSSLHYFETVPTYVPATMVSATLFCPKSRLGVGGCPSSPADAKRSVGTNSLFHQD